MNGMSASVTVRFVDAIVARDFAGTFGLMHPEIDFRAMKPRRVWEAGDPTVVGDAMRTWLDDPERPAERNDATETTNIEDTLRVGWRVRGRDADGAFTFERQAYMGEEVGQIVWLRVMCSGPRSAEAGSPG